MAPFRAARSTRSGRPGNHNDSDLLDGLPVRQWSVQDAAIGAAQSNTNTTVNPAAATAPLEAHGPIGPSHPALQLPKGSALYAPWSQQLLRAARQGNVIKKSDGDISPRRQRDEDKENNEGEDGPNAKEDRGFVLKKWAPVPRHLEAPEQEYLAKRRKGLARVIVVDAITGETVNLRPDATGLDVAPFGPAVAPDEAPKSRRLPPPRRKPKKGPGRGRRKMIPSDRPIPQPEETQMGTSSQPVIENQSHPQPEGDEGRDEEDEGENGEDEEGEEGDEGEEGEEVDGEEGDEGNGEEGDDDDDREEGELSDAQDDAHDDVRDDAHDTARDYAHDTAPDDALDNISDETLDNAVEPESVVANNNPLLHADETRVEVLQNAVEKTLIGSQSLPPPSEIAMRQEQNLSMMNDDMQDVQAQSDSDFQHIENRPQTNQTVAPAEDMTDITDLGASIRDLVEDISDGPEA